MAWRIRLVSRARSMQCAAYLRRIVGQENEEKAYDAAFAAVGESGLIVCDAETGRITTPEGKVLWPVEKKAAPAPKPAPEPDPEPEDEEDEDEEDEEPQYKKVRGGGFCCGVCGKVLKTEKGILQHIEDKH